jgi:glycosyltransferase involved in cell wall biosynthesis
MRSLAIVSSYAESCGNAAFTRALHDSIEHYHPDVAVEVMELDLRLLQSIKSAIRTKGDAHIKGMARELRGFDAVNIQMEAGLYGSLPHDVLRRFRRLLKANPRTSVTLHSPRLIGSAEALARQGIKKLLQLQVIAGLRDMMGDNFANITVRLNHRVIRACVRQRAPLIVHTGRAARQIRDFFSYENTAVHCLKLVPAGFAPSGATLRAIRTRMGLDDGAVVVGIFGYLSAYKGHVDALLAMEHLPERYKLLIFGRQHPQTLASDGRVDSYLEHLIHRVKTTPQLQERVFFLGELADREFFDVVSSVDAAWLPYYENGQDGSGIASICLDLCPRVLCSASFAFDELFKLVTYQNVNRFDVGNPLELALKTEMMMRAPVPPRPYGDESAYNLASQAQVYVRQLLD